MEIIQNVFTDDELVLLLQDLDNKLSVGNWSNQRVGDYITTSYHQAYDNLVLFCAVSDEIKILLRKKLIRISTDMRYYDFVASYNLWKKGSSAPMHKDGHCPFSATFYLNKDWTYDYGGFLLWEEEQNLLKGFSPTFNSCAFNAKKVMHCVTEVTDSAKEDRITIQIFGKQ